MITNGDKKIYFLPGDFRRSKMEIAAKNLPEIYNSRGTTGFEYIDFEAFGLTIMLKKCAARHEIMGKIYEGSTKFMEPS